jgi:Leu/Phe-tRNA-protein transferase
MNHATQELQRLLELYAITVHDSEPVPIVKMFTDGSTRSYWKARIFWWRTTKRERMIVKILKAPVTLSSIVRAYMLNLSVDLNVTSTHDSCSVSSTKYWKSSKLF